jgi:hypothetical protein
MKAIIRIEQMAIELSQRLLYKYVSTEKLKASKFLTWMEMAILGRILRLEAAIYPNEIPIETANALISGLKEIVKN